MRALVIVLFCAVMLEAAVYKTNLRSTGSLRKRLIKSGRYAKFLEAYLRNKASGKLPLNDYYDDTYLCNITVGTPPQQFVVIPDTSSSDLWIVGSECTSDACKGFPDSGYTKHRFDTSASSTFHKIGDSYELTYGGGACMGYTADDVLSFGGLTVKSQIFLVATSITDYFGYDTIDGMVGLAWQDLATFSTSTVMQNLIPQLDLPLFTVWMDRILTPSEGSVGGQITFGGYDNDHCDTAINWVPLTSKTYWEFQMDGVALGSYKQKNLKAQIISDTATSYIGGPNANIGKIVAEAGGSMDYRYRIYVIPCSKQTTAPDLILTINNVDYSIPAVEYILNWGIGGGMCAMTFFDMDGGGFSPAWILGDTFFRAYCNIHNFGGESIGFSRAKHSQL